MGASLSWLAVKGKPTPEILAGLRLRGSGARGLDGEAPVVGAPSDGGWYLLVLRGAEHRLPRSAVLERLSVGCEILTCTVWQVTHRGEDGPVGIEEEGTLPPEYPAIREPQGRL